MSEQLTAYVTNPCDRCGHGPDVHRFDDYRLSEFDYVPWAERPFRCLGGDFPAEGYGPCEVACPDFLGEPITWLDEVTT